MRFAVLAIGLTPGAAFAHGGTVAHAHPHGSEGLILGLAVIALAAGVAWIRR